MFTGIVESTGSVTRITQEGKNLRFGIRSSFTHELKVDQSVAHNGACLTVVAINGDEYEVVVIDESIKRTNLGALQQGDLVNLERSMKLNDRLDGHMVQGHVDAVAVVKDIREQDGSWLMRFEYDSANGNITVEKGSICVNGVSLTVVDSEKKSFSVAVIPYTWKHTNFHLLKVGSKVNIEFDVIGKYVARLLKK